MSPVTTGVAQIKTPQEMSTGINRAILIPAEICPNIIGVAHTKKPAELMPGTSIGSPKIIYTEITPGIYGAAPINILAKISPVTNSIIASAISSNQNALFVPCDNIVFGHDASYSVNIAPGSLSHVYIALGRRAAAMLSFVTFQS